VSVDTRAPVNKAFLERTVDLDENRRTVPRTLVALPDKLIQFLLFSFTRIVLAIGRFTRFFTPTAGNTGEPGKLAIESGAKGWELIEYQEIHRSACEYFGNDSVAKVVVDDRRRYLRELRKSLRLDKPTHYFYDPRTGCQGRWRSLWQSLAVALILQWNGIIPIAWLTDLPVRRWRRQCFIVTAHSGVTVTLMSAERMRGLFPHHRLTGPSIMAVSAQRLEHLRSLRAIRPQASDARAVFSGSLYEPRSTILNEIGVGVRKRGRQLEILARPLSGARVTNEEYWARLVQSDIVVTTADQIVGPGIDDLGMPHLIFRYSEALAAGALLIAPTVPGIERYFIPGTHFVSFGSPDDAAEKICFYLNNEDARLEICRAGSARFASLVHLNSYWVTIDCALGTESLTS